MHDSYATERGLAVPTPARAAAPRRAGGRATHTIKSPLEKSMGAQNSFSCACDWERFGAGEGKGVGAPRSGAQGMRNNSERRIVSYAEASLQSNPASPWHRAATAQVPTAERYPGAPRPREKAKGSTRARKKSVATRRAARGKRGHRPPRASEGARRWHLNNQTTKLNRLMHGGFCIWHSQATIFAGEDVQPAAQAPCAPDQAGDSPGERCLVRPRLK